MHDLAGALWRTSSRSNDQGLCVEVADNLVAVLGLVGGPRLQGPGRTDAGRQPAGLDGVRRRHPGWPLRTLTGAPEPVDDRRRASAETDSVASGWWKFRPGGLVRPVTARTVDDTGGGMSTVTVSRLIEAHGRRLSGVC